MSSLHRSQRLICHSFFFHTFRKNTAMPLIITATDLSAVADNAINYACQLAMAQNAQVTIIHSFVFPVMFSDLPLPANLINETENDLDAQMKRTVSKFRNAYPT